MKKLWLVFLSVLVAILALTACSTEVNDGKIDGIDKLPAKVEVTGLEGVTGTVEAKPLDEKALADAFAAVREVYYVAEGADYLAADISITNDGKPVTLGKPVTVSITVPDTFTLSLDKCVVFHIHNGAAEQITPTVSDGKLTFTVDSFSPFVIVPLHEHVYGEWQPFNGSLPTCTESALEIRKCSCGETERREVLALGHIDENGDGKCDRCGISLDGTHTHEFGEWQPLNGSLPTCTESALEIRKCSCGETERREVLALGHIDENGDDYCDRCREYLGGNEPAVTNDAYTREGDYIYFGSYPQTVVTDDRVKIGLTALAGDLPTAEDSKNWTSYGYYIEGEVVDYMWYIDLAYNEVKYRGVYFTSYRPDETHRLSKAANSQQDDNGYNVSTVYWFKYEPIKWRILSEANGEALILCEMIIDSREYCNFDEETQQTVKYSHNGGNGYANNYALSDIRAWLNDTFYNTAFSALQKEYIKLTTVKNDLTSANPNSDPTFETRDKYVSFLCEDTEDHIFLLSFQEATNDAYGYNPDMENVADAAREKIPTDYAKSQGVKVSKDTGYVGNGTYWWLRTPAEYATYSSRGVLYNGAAGGGIGVSNVHVGVVPALVINLGAEE